MGAALAQVGEFAFVLLTFTVASGVVPTPLARFLAAATALSMALTPLVMGAYERLAALKPIRSPAEPEATPFDTGAPDVIVAGFGRFGQVAARLLIANGFNLVVLDSSIEHIELVRRFGRRVHYGDATRLDLLRSAGAEEAKLLIVAIDDRDQAVQMVETVRRAFPDLTILARAWDRRHAYDLLRSGAHQVERETFEGGLSMGGKALRALGLKASIANRAMAVFRQHDQKAFEALAPAWGEEERYILASRDSQQTMERVLMADMAQIKADAAEEAGEGEASQAVAQ